LAILLSGHKIIKKIVYKSLKIDYTKKESVSLRLRSHKEYGGGIVLSPMKKDINSTEKLLNVIRGKDEKSFGALGKQKKSGNSLIKNVKVNSTKKIFDKKKYTVGIDIGEELVCLVKTAGSPDGTPILIDTKIIKYNPQLSENLSEFGTYLKPYIIDFCGAISDCEVWTKILTSQVGIFFFNIPRVPKNQWEKVVFWTAKKEGYIDEEKNVFDFEIQGEVIEQGNPKYSVMVYTASRSEIEKIKSFFSEMGITLAGITTVPFAIQNIFRSKWVPATEEVFANLFIGNNYSRIDVYYKENLVMTRGIKTGSIRSMAEAIISGVFEKNGKKKLTINQAKEILSFLGSDSEKNQSIKTLFGVDKEEILGMISPVMERLVRQVDLTLKTSSSIESQKVEKIYIRSAVDVEKSILDYISSQLGIKTEFFDPMGRQVKSFNTESYNVSEGVLLSSALGFALSANQRTPNVIFTYVEKQKEVIAKRINRFILISFMVVIAGCLLTIIYQGSKLNMLTKSKVSLEKELAFYSPPLALEKVIKAANEVKTQNRMSKQYAEKYFSLAAIGELSHLTPSNIRLINLKINQGVETDKTELDKPILETDISMEGIVQGSKDMLDADLTQYVIKLENSKMFGKISMQKKETVSFNNKDVIHFILNAKAGDE
jgi:hypothetical protein